MDLDSKIIELLAFTLIGLFSWALKYRVAAIDKEIDILRQENSYIKSTYITSKNFATFSDHLEVQIQRIEDNMNARMTTLEKNISDRLDLYLRMVDSKTEKRT